MTTKPQRFAPAYVPLVCEHCGHLIQRTEWLTCRCCGARWPGVTEIRMGQREPTNDRLQQGVA